MATKIAALGRGYIDRELLKAREEQRYFLHTVTPAAVLIQSQWRGYTKRRDLAEHKRRWLAALFIQVAYRGAVFRRHARTRFQAWVVLHKGFSAAKIQCLFRKWCARQLYRVRLVEAGWRRTFATRIILRTWRSYQMNQKLEELKEHWRVEKAALALADAQDEIKESSSKRNTCPPSEKHLERKNEELPCYQQVCVIKRNQRQPAQQSGPSHAASSCSAT